MEDYYENMMREVDNHISTIDLNGTHIIDDCKTTILLEKKKKEMISYKNNIYICTRYDEIHILYISRHISDLGI